MSNPCQCRGGYQPRIGEYVRHAPYSPLLTTAGPLVEPEPSITIGDPPPFEIVTDDPLSPRPSPLAGAWQCPGCGTIYNMTVNSCQCQVHRFTSNSTTFQFYDRAKPMGTGGV